MPAVTPDRIFVRTILFPRIDFDQFPLVFCQVLANNYGHRNLDRDDVILMHKVNCVSLRIMVNDPDPVNFNRGNSYAWIQPAHIICKIAEANCLEILQQLNSQM